MLTASKDTLKKRAADSVSIALISSAVTFWKLFREVVAQTKGGMLPEHTGIGVGMVGSMVGEVIGDGVGDKVGDGVRNGVAFDGGGRVTGEKVEFVVGNKTTTLYRNSDKPVRGREKKKG